MKLQLFICVKVDRVEKEIKSLKNVCDALSSVTLFDLSI
jgi:hypothetical protein